MGVFIVRKVEKYTHWSNGNSGYEESRGVCTQPWNKTCVLWYKSNVQHWPKPCMKNTETAVSQVAGTQFTRVIHQIQLIWTFRSHRDQFQYDGISAS